MEIQITQMAMPEMVKKSRVNQSISAPMLRRSVGRAKAASMEMAGRPSSSARSAGWVLRVAPPPGPTATVAGSGGVAAGAAS
jgi:hypothetical protein